MLKTFKTPNLYFTAQLLLLLLPALTCAQVEVVTFTGLQQQAEAKSNDTLYVLNFWATWCKPCLEEMPYFEEASEKFAGQKVRILYVSVNSVKEVKGVTQFAERGKIRNRVLLLNAPNPNDWIDKIDPNWSGAIPATVMYKKGRKLFFREGEMTREELDSAIINNNK